MRAFYGFIHAGKAWKSLKNCGGLVWILCFPLFSGVFAVFSGLVPLGNDDYPVFTVRICGVFRFSSLAQKTLDRFVSEYENIRPESRFHVPVYLPVGSVRKYSGTDGK